jgi:hypothetical protein
MPTLFATKPGTVAQLDDPAAQCDIRFSIQQPAEITFQTQRSIVTQLTVHQQVNVQFLHTLGSLIYIYVFGDRMGQVSLSGLAFACQCPDSNDSGASKMMEWYKSNRTSKNKDPVRVTIGDTTIEGFVTSFDEHVVDVALKLVQWDVNMASLPEA